MTPTTHDVISTAEFGALLGVSGQMVWSISKSDRSCPKPQYVHSRCAAWPRDEAVEFARTREIRRRGNVATHTR